MDIIEFLTYMMEFNEIAVVASPYHMAEHELSTGNDCSGLGSNFIRKKERDKETHLPP